jgi:hypothetical protein
MTLQKLNNGITPYLDPVNLDTLGLTASVNQMQFNNSPVNTFSLFLKLQW